MKSCNECSMIWFNRYTRVDCRNYYYITLLPWQDRSGSRDSRNYSSSSSSSTWNKDNQNSWGSGNQSTWGQQGSWGNQGWGQQGWGQQNYNQGWGNQVCICVINLLSIGIFRWFPNNTKRNNRDVTEKFKLHIDQTRLRFRLGYGLFSLPKTMDLFWDHVLFYDILNWGSKIWRCPQLVIYSSLREHIRSLLMKSSQSPVEQKSGLY